MRRVPKGGGRGEGKFPGGDRREGAKLKSTFIDYGSSGGPFEAIVSSVPSTVLVLYSRLDYLVCRHAVTVTLFFLISTVLQYVKSPKIKIHKNAGKHEIKILYSNL